LVTSRCVLEFPRHRASQCSAQAVVSSCFATSVPSLLVTIELCSRWGHALVDVHVPDAANFITCTNAIVAPGQEWRHLDLDAAIAAIRAAASN